jgi:methionine salvage enolase-phosphatase E1
MSYYLISFSFNYSGLRKLTAESEVKQLLEACNIFTLSGHAWPNGFLSKYMKSDLVAKAIYEILQQKLLELQLKVLLYQVKEVPPSHDPYKAEITSLEEYFNRAQAPNQVG